MAYSSSVNTDFTMIFSAVYSVEFVLTGVLRQEVDYVSYRIEPKPPQNGHK